MTPVCELPSGVLRQWHVFVSGVCECGTEETILKPVVLPRTSRIVPVKMSKAATLDALNKRTARLSPPDPGPEPVAPQEALLPEPTGPGFVCPSCLKTAPITSVTESRIQPGRIRRRRKCPFCKERFTTYEKLAPKEEDGRRTRWRRDGAGS